MSLTKTFNPEVDFCPGCGSLLPSLKSAGDVTCLACKFVVVSTLFDDQVIKYTVEFNSADAFGKKKKDESEDGPVVDRDCPKCDSMKMSYATAQLRSADEGQTVFFTCIKCKYKERENS